MGAGIVEQRAASRRTMRNNRIDRTTDCQPSPVPGGASQDHLSAPVSPRPAYFFQIAGSVSIFTKMPPTTDLA